MLKEKKKLSEQHQGKNEQQKDVQKGIEQAQRTEVEKKFSNQTDKEKEEEEEKENKSKDNRLTLLNEIRKHNKDVDEKEDDKQEAPTQQTTTRPLSWAKLFSRPAPPRIKNTKSNKEENKKSSEGDKSSDKTTNATKSTEKKKQNKIAERKAMFEVKKKAPQTERKNEGQTKEISTELMPKNYKISLLGSHLKIKESEIREKRDALKKIMEQNHLAARDLPRLILVKGRRRPACRLVPLSATALSTKDSYVLDPGKGAKVVYQWSGLGSSRVARGWALDLAKSIAQGDRMCVGVRGFVEGEEEEAFWKLLGEKPKTISQSSEDDLVWERAAASSQRLLRLHLREKKSDEIIDPPHVRACLFGCCLLDLETELYLWIGDGIKSDEVKQAKEYAQKLLSERTHWCAPLSVEYKERESPLFRYRFVGWGTLPISVAPQIVSSNKQKLEQKEIDVASLCALVERQDDFCVDDGKGEIQLWIIRDFHLVPLRLDSAGMFYDEESYVILYKYLWKNKDSHIVYFWQGSASPILARGASAGKAIEIDNLLKNVSANSKEIRVVEGREPKHFLSIFKGKFRVRFGKDPSIPDAKAQKSKRAWYKGLMHLFKISGDDEIHLSARETFFESVSSSACYIIENEGECGIWKGEFATNEEVNFARNIVKEANEWKKLEIREYAMLPESLSVISSTSRVNLKLYSCSEASGIFESLPLSHPIKEDLIPEDCVIADCGDVVYAWRGRKSSVREVKMTMELTVRVAEYLSKERKKSIDARVINQGNEQAPFTVLFPSWPTASRPESVLETPQDFLNACSATYSYDSLVSRTAPVGIDHSRLESYLCDDEFCDVFGMTKDVFYALPLWKQQKLKKERKLY